MDSAKEHAGVEAHGNISSGDLEICPLVQVAEQLRLVVGKSQKWYGYNGDTPRMDMPWHNKIIHMCRNTMYMHSTHILYI